MAKFSLIVYLTLLVALSDVYETQAQLEPETVVSHLDKTFPKMGKDFEPYAYKGLLDFVGELEVKCPPTKDFKDFFAKLRDYIVFSFKPASLGSAEMSVKARRLSNSMSALRGTKDTSVYYFTLIDSLVSLQKAVVEMKKNSWNEITLDQRRKLWSFITKWFSSISFFVKEAAEKKGKSIDLTPLGISTNDVEANNSYIATVNKTQGSFSFPDYLKNFPKMGKDFEPFAYKGMLDFVGDLEVKCPKDVEFKDFFAKLRDYMAGFQSVSPDSFSIRVDTNMTLKSKSLFRAMAALNGTGGTLDPWRLVDSLSSMGNALVEMRKSGATQITPEKQKILTWSMVNWARAVSALVKTASAKKGVSIDISSFEAYYYSHILIPSTTKGPRSGANVPKGKVVTKAGPGKGGNGGNVPKGTSANNNSNSTKPK